MERTKSEVDTSSNTVSKSERCQNEVPTSSSVVAADWCGVGRGARGEPRGRKRAQEETVRPIDERRVFFSDEISPNFFIFR
jgi:hypothetical protein